MGPSAMWSPRRRRRVWEALHHLRRLPGAVRAALRGALRSTAFPVAVAVVTCAAATVVAAVRAVPQLTVQLGLLVGDPNAWALLGLATMVVALASLGVAVVVARDPELVVHLTVVPAGVVVVGSILFGLVLDSSFTHERADGPARWVAPLTVHRDVVAPGEPAGLALSEARRTLGARASHLGATLRSPVRLAGGQVCSLAVRGGRTTAVLCSDGASVRVARFSGRVPGPGLQWGPTLGSVAAAAVPGTHANWGDVYGQMDRSGRAELVVPLLRRRGVTVPIDVPAGALVVDADGTAHHVLAGRTAASAATVQGPTVPRSWADATLRSVVERRRDERVTGRSWPALVWRGDRAVWVAVSSDAQHASSPAVVELDATPAQARPSAVVVAPRTPWLTSEVAARAAARATGRRTSTEPGDTVALPGGRWRLRSGRDVVVVDGGLRVCVETPTEACAGTTASATDASVRLDGRPLNELSVDELVAQRRLVQHELDRRGG